MTTALIVVATVLAVAAGTWLLLFNRLVRLRNKTDNAWRQIDVQLNRRYDLLLELVEVVKGYASHEKETLVAAAKARAEAINVSSVGKQGTAEDNLTGAIGGLLAVAESYPNLLANREFLKYQKELATTENRIAGARKYYNGAVMYYDNARQSFPGNIVVHLFPDRFTDREYFEIQEPADRQVPDVSVDA